MADLPLPPPDADVIDTVCQFCNVGCGYRVYAWPIGRSGTPDDNALGDFSARQAPMTGIPYGPTMHNIVLRDGAPHHIAIVPADGPINPGRNHSARGAVSAQCAATSDGPTRDRLKWPLLRVGGELVPVPWEHALEVAGGVLASVLESDGPEAICAKAFDHGGGGGGFENNWAVGKLLFEGIGTSHVAIHNRPAYNSEVWGSRDRGVHELHTTAEDGHLCDTLVIWGANPYETATVYYLEHLLPNFRGETGREKVAAFGEEPPTDVRWVVVDPRRTSSLTIPESIDRERVLHLRPNPGTDVVLADAIARVVHDRGWLDRQFIAERTDARSFETYSEGSLRLSTSRRRVLADASRITGIDVADIEEAARWIARPVRGRRRRTLTVYEKGVIWNYRNYDTVAAVVQLSALTGNIGHPGTGCGRQGGHQEGYVRPGYPGARPPVNVDQHLIDGGGKVFWVMGTNPYRSTPRAQDYREAIGRRRRSVQVPGGSAREQIDAITSQLKGDGLFMMVSELYLTQTAADAHLVFPAAGWGESELTSINCNSRLLRLYDRFMDPPGEARPDWAICQGVARTIRRALGHSDLAARFEGWEWTGPEDVFLEGGASFPDNAVDTAAEESLPAECYAGVDYALLRTLGQEGIPTPVRRSGDEVLGTKRRYLERFGSDDGRFHWHGSDPWTGYPEALEIDDAHPFWLTTGRHVHVWQTGYHDQRLFERREEVPLPYVEIHPEDASRYGVRALELVELTNRFGAVTVQARITDAVPPGQLFALQYHWKGTANALITSYTDPKTTIPWYKGARVALRRVGPVETTASTLDATHFGPAD